MKSSFCFFILIIASCTNSDKPKSELTIPDIMLRNNLGNQYLQTKWEMYKYNKYHGFDTLYFDSLKTKVPFVQCDLILYEKDSFYINHVRNDTVKTIGFEPYFNGDRRSNFYSGSKMNTYYGASFKSDSLKYIPCNDGVFQVIENDDFEKRLDSVFIEFIKANRDKVNPWLIEYAEYKGFLKK